MDEDAGIFAAQCEPLETVVQVGVASGRLLQISFPDEPDPTAGNDHPILEAVITTLASGDSEAIADVPVVLTLPTDQRRVLETLQEVPPGEEVTTAALARMTPQHDPEDRSLVEAALSANPAPVVIPDHRVRDAAGATPAPVREHLRDLEGL